MTIHTTLSYAKVHANVPATGHRHDRHLLILEPYPVIIESQDVVHKAV